MEKERGRVPGSGTHQCPLTEEAERERGQGGEKKQQPGRRAAAAQGWQWISQFRNCYRLDRGKGCEGSYDGVENGRGWKL